MSKHVAALALVSVALLAPAIARAQQDSAGAEALFQKGHQLFEEKRYAEACPKFAESFRLDPVTGSLLALAACHDAEGKLASAWAEYVDVATRARREGKNDRADAAQHRAAAIEPKLARLTIALAQGADAVAELQVKRDGIVIGPAAFGTSLPVDRGEHVIEATAPGHEPFSRRITMVDGQKELVPIPLLAESPRAATDPAPVATPGPRPHAEAPQAAPFPLRTLGIVTAAVGLVTVGIGGYFGLRAIGKNSDSNAANHCINDACDSTGRALRMNAISAGNTSTALFVVGGLLTGGGVVMYLVGGSSGGGEAKPAVAAAPAVAPGLAGLALTGRF